MPSPRPHDVCLESRTAGDVHIRLRPMTGDDWDILFAWNNDPQMLYYAEEDDVTSYSLAHLQEVYCQICADAFCFIIEVDGRPIGECWLQQMNIARVLRMYPGLDCRRIDLAIGHKSYWNRGIGTCVIRLLTEYAFLSEQADIVYEPGISDYNVRSRRAFEKAGYKVKGKTAYRPGKKAQYLYDLALTREEFLSERERQDP